MRGAFQYQRSGTSHHVTKVHFVTWWKLPCGTEEKVTKTPFYSVIITLTEVSTPSRCPGSRTAGRCSVAADQPAALVGGPEEAPVALARGAFAAHEGPKRVVLVVQLVGLVVVRACHYIEHRVESVGAA